MVLKSRNAGAVTTHVFANAPFFRRGAGGSDQIEPAEQGAGAPAATAGGCGCARPPAPLAVDRPTAASARRVAAVGLAEDPRRSAISRPITSGAMPCLKARTARSSRLRWPHCAVSVGQGGAGQHDADHRHQHARARRRRIAAGIEADVPAHQRHEQHVGARRGLGERDRGAELGLGQPVVLLDQEAVHLGRRCGSRRRSTAATAAGIGRTG